MPQCQGRRTTTKSSPLFFAGCPRLHKNKPLSFLGPVRCAKDADDLCKECQARLKSTENQLEKRGNKYIPNQETMFHGRISEPIPAWSRLYKGTWFEAQIQAGYTLSEETQQTLKKMCDATYKDIPTNPVANMILGAVVEIEIPPPPVKAEPKRKKKATGVVAEPEAVAPPPVKAEPKRKKKGVTPPAPAPVVPAPPKKKIQLKKIVTTPAVTTPAVTTPAITTPAITTPAPKKKRILKPKVVAPPITGFVNPTATLEEEPKIVKISVKKAEIDGRSVYLESSKDKVYDLKFNYIGRFNRSEDRIDTTYPDSDAE
jgi:hypothetical protein